MEEYSFSLDELHNQTGKTESSVKSELSRLASKKEILNLRKGFYLIITPRYSTAQKIPVQLYCEKFFKYLERNYYLGFYSAARLHGASHQQVQRDYLMIQSPKLKDISKKTIDIRFLTTTCWPAKNIQTKQSDAGEYRVSSPALTAADLIHYQSKLGGINRMLATIEELAELIHEQDVMELLSWYPHRSTIQRLGFLLEEVGADPKILDVLFSSIDTARYFPVLLSPQTNQKPGAVGNRWKVDVNVKMESDI